MVLTAGNRSRPTGTEICPMPLCSTQILHTVDWLVSNPDFRVESNLKYLYKIQSVPRSKHSPYQS
jgi:hypothetical protein